MIAPFQTIFLPCNSTAHFDGEFSYRCDICFAVVVKTTVQVVNAGPVYRGDFNQKE